MRRTRDEHAQSGKREANRRLNSRAGGYCECHMNCLFQYHNQRIPIESSDGILVSASIFGWCFEFWL